MCDQGLSGDGSSGWKLHFDPFVVRESWLTSRRNGGISDEAICDELTGRDTTYLNSIPSLTENFYMFQGTKKSTGHSTVAPDKSLTIKRGYWHGYSSNSYMTNPQRDIHIGNIGWVFSATSKPCNSNVMRTESDFISGLYNHPCNSYKILSVSREDLVFYFGEDQNIQSIREQMTPNLGFFGFTFTNNPPGRYNLIQYPHTYALEYLSLKRSYSANKSVSNCFSYGCVSSTVTTTLWDFDIPSTTESPLVFYSDFRSESQPFPLPTSFSSHTFAIAPLLKVNLVNSTTVRTSQTQIGEAHGVAFRIKTKFYAPNGRLIDLYVHWAGGKY